MFYDVDCPWYVFDSSYKTLLGAFIIIFGSLGLLLNSWLFITFIHSHLLTFKSHVLVLNLCTASLGRCLLGFPFAGSSALAERWLFGAHCCQVFAFFNQFLGVLQMSALVVLAVERFFLVKCYKNEKELSVKSYILLVSVCWLSGAVLSIPPLTAYGTYSCDVTNTACTLDWSMGSARQIGFNLPYVLVGAVLPVIAIIIFIGKTIPLEKRFYRSEIQKEQRVLTKSIVITILTSLLLWTPAGVLCGWQAIAQLLLGYRQQPPVTLVLLATFSELATSVPVLVYLMAEPRIGTALLGRVKKNYAIIRNQSWRPAGDF